MRMAGQSLSASHITHGRRACFPLEWWRSEKERRSATVNPAGSGLRLIAALVRQIGGTVDQDSSNQGTTTSLIFPVI